MMSDSIFALAMFALSGAPDCLISFSVIATKDIASFKEFIARANQDNIDAINKKIHFKNKLRIYNQPLQEQLHFDAVKEEPAIYNNTSKPPSKKK